MTISPLFISSSTKPTIRRLAHHEAHSRSCLWKVSRPLWDLTLLFIYTALHLSSSLSCWCEMYLRSYLSQVTLLFLFYFQPNSRPLRQQIQRSAKPGILSRSRSSWSVFPVLVLKGVHRSLSSRSRFSSMFLLPRWTFFVGFFSV